MIAGTTQLSQKHYAVEVLRTYGYWDTPRRITRMEPNTRLSIVICLQNPIFINVIIVSSLGYLVTMTRPDLAW